MVSSPLLHHRLLQHTRSTVADTLTGVNRKYCLAPSRFFSSELSQAFPQNFTQASRSRPDEEIKGVLGSHGREKTMKAKIYLKQFSPSPEG